MDTNLNNQKLEEESSSRTELAKLLRLGQQQGVLTLGDVFDYFPEAEQDDSLLAEILGAMREAGVELEIDSEEMIAHRRGGERSLPRCPGEAGSETLRPKPHTSYRGFYP